VNNGSKKKCRHIFGIFNQKEVGEELGMMGQFPLAHTHTKKFGGKYRCTFGEDIAVKIGS
jgi:hypothetical protein